MREGHSRQQDKPEKSPWRSETDSTRGWASLHPGVPLALSGLRPSQCHYCGQVRKASMLYPMDFDCSLLAMKSRRSAPSRVVMRADLHLKDSNCSKMEAGLEGCQDVDGNTLTISHWELLGACLQWEQTGCIERAGAQRDWGRIITPKY